MSAVQPNRLTSTLEVALAQTRAALERAGTPAIGNQRSDGTVRAGHQVTSSRPVGSAIGTERGRPVIGRVPTLSARRAGRTLTRSFVQPSSKFRCQRLGRNSLVISSETGDVLHNLQGELLQDVLDYYGRSEVTYIEDLVGNVPVNSIHAFLEKPGGEYDRIVVLSSGELRGVRPGEDLPQIDGDPVLLTFRRHDAPDPASADGHVTAVPDDLVENAEEFNGPTQRGATRGSESSTQPASNAQDSPDVSAPPMVSAESTASITSSTSSPSVSSVPGVALPTELDGPQVESEDSASSSAMSVRSDGASDPVGIAAPATVSAESTASITSSDSTISVPRSALRFESPVESEDSVPGSALSVRSDDASSLAGQANPPLPARAAAVRRQIAELRERHGRGAQNLRANTPFVRHDQFNERADAFDQAMAKLADIAEQYGDDPDVITILENGLAQLSQIESSLAQQLAESITRSAQNIVNSFGSGVLDTASRRMK